LMWWLENKLESVLARICEYVSCHCTQNSTMKWI